MRTHRHGCTITFRFISLTGGIFLFSTNFAFYPFIDSLQCACISTLLTIFIIAWLSQTCKTFFIEQILSDLIATIIFITQYLNVIIDFSISWNIDFYSKCWYKYVYQILVEICAFVVDCPKSVPLFINWIIWQMLQDILSRY